jgi:hypothetical protein
MCPIGFRDDKKSLEASYPVLYCTVLSHPVLSCPGIQQGANILSCPVSSCPILSWHSTGSKHPTLSCLILSYLVLAFNREQTSYPVLSHPILSCPGIQQGANSRAWAHAHQSHAAAARARKPSPHFTCAARTAGPGKTPRTCLCVVSKKSRYPGAAWPRSSTKYGSTYCSMLVPWRTTKHGGASGRPARSRLRNRERRSYLWPSNRVRMPSSACQTRATVSYWFKQWDIRGTRRVRNEGHVGEQAARVMAAPEHGVDALGEVAAAALGLGGQRRSVLRLSVRAKHLRRRRTPG